MFVSIRPITRSQAFTRFLSTSPSVLAGHSKWANIKHDKARNDAQKNKVANKFAMMVAVAAKLGGPDVSKNIRLAAAVDAASKANVSKKVIEKAINRGAGIGSSGEKENVDQAVYEGIGPGNVSFVVEALTDNKTRTFSNVRAAFAKFGGSLSPTLFQFDRKGFVSIDKGENDFETVFEKIVDLGAEDIEEVEGNETMLEVMTDPSDTGKIAAELKKEYTIKEVGITYIAKTDSLITIEDEETREKYNKFINFLEDVEDVTDYYTTLKE
ncbi:CYFA0S10e02014g1_1 [Cyberlindnera fabianii]|uniref:CYFA0S10e02014g1_1 n=1 Tax=Cyberlindnera fabianii TaxID=36022 RepID=A0A061AYY4_CYBFA|nr:CYFA0S10e02014g1_1 [Cyberlindnera fabianii]